MFKDVLKQLRESRGLTQEELAKIIGTTAGSIGNYEQGTRIPRNPIMRKIANYFEVSIDYLLGFEGYDKSQDITNSILSYVGSDTTKQEIANTLKEVLDKTDDRNTLELLKNVLDGFNK